MSGNGAIRELAKRWEAACRAGDDDAIVGLLSEDAVVWYNYERVEHDRAGYRRILEDSRQWSRNPRYGDLRVHFHDGGFVEQATLEVDTDDGSLAIPFLLIATVKNDRIVRIEEYFDSTIMRAKS